MSFTQKWSKCYYTATHSVQLISKPGFCLNVDFHMHTVRLVPGVGGHIHTKSYPHGQGEWTQSFPRPHYSLARCLPSTSAWTWLLFCLVFLFNLIKKIIHFFEPENRSCVRGIIDCGLFQGRCGCWTPFSIYKCKLLYYIVIIPVMSSKDALLALHHSQLEFIFQRALFWIIWDFKIVFKG